MRRIMKMIAGGGLSITGSHTMCGDYLYSGHTVMLTLTYLFIKECKFLCIFIFFFTSKPHMKLILLHIYKCAVDHFAIRLCTLTLF